MLLAACDNSPPPPAPDNAYGDSQQPVPTAPLPDAPVPQTDVAVASPTPAPSTPASALARSSSRRSNRCSAPGRPISATATAARSRISQSRFEGAENGCDIASIVDTGGWNFVATLSCTSQGGTAQERIGMVPLYAPSGEGIGLTYLDRDNQQVTVLPLRLMPFAHRKPGVAGPPLCDGGRRRVRPASQVADHAAPHRRRPGRGGRRADPRARAPRGRGHPAPARRLAGLGRLQPPRAGRGVSGEHPSPIATWTPRRSASRWASPRSSACPRCCRSARSSRACRGDAFDRRQHRQRRRTTSRIDADMVDMETYAVLRACQRFTLAADRASRHLRRRRGAAAASRAGRSTFTSSTSAWPRRSTCSRPRWQRARWSTPDDRHDRDLSARRRCLSSPPMARRSAAKQAALDLIGATYGAGCRDDRGPRLAARR